MVKGSSLTNSHKEKISRALKGRNVWNKGKKGIYRKETINKIRNSALNQFKNGMPAETKEKIRIALKGKPKSKEHIQKLKGNKSSQWKGGISPINDLIRKSIEFRLWREAVFARDNWVCQKCKDRGDKIHSHHIQNFSQYPELRFAIDNGITLCKKCHQNFHKKYGIKNNNINQLKEFLKL